MPLTSIADQKTPARPVEITFEADTGTPSDNQELLIIGHRASGAASGSSETYKVVTISNAGDLTAASGECATKFGEGSELQKMILAAIRANQDTQNFVAIKAIPLDFADTDFGTADAALTSAQKVKAEFIVSPYAGSDATLRGKLKDHAALVSGAQRVSNNQFGSFGVVAERAQTDPSLLPKFDSQFVIGIWLRDTGVGGDAPSYSLGEVASSCAARMAANIIPFNPLDDATINGLSAPKKSSDFITVGAALESESALNQGWTPLWVKPTGEVAFVRTVTGRISPDGTGSPVVTSYYDVQDFQQLYFWRKTLYTRFSQTDFKQRKASVETAKQIKSEMIRLARLFEEDGMFQSVDDLSKEFQVERSTSDRHRFDVLTPVNVVPGLHVIATNVAASTRFDTFSI